MPNSDSLPLILFSGLAADASVFTPQKLVFPHLIVPTWPAPLKNDTLDSYCERIAAELRPLGPAIIGGASFGGIVALHVAKYLDPLAVVLIGSVRGSHERPLWIRSGGFLGPLVPFVPVRLLQWLTMPFTMRLPRRMAPHWSGLAGQFVHADPAVLCWSLRRMLDWQDTPGVRCPVFHIHGGRDLVLSPRNTKPDQLIPRGGHVISLTHAREVNEFIQTALERVERDEREVKPG
jgi:pimeloyl-ACP methyl ester carboxylesterase